MSFLDKLISLLKKNSNVAPNSSESEAQERYVDAQSSKLMVESTQNQDTQDKTQLNTSNTDPLEAIRAAEEERRKKEWLEFLRSKRAKRKKELEEELIILDKQLEYIQQCLKFIKEEKKSITKSESPSFHISISGSSTITPIEYKVPDTENITSMAEYECQRIEEERRKIEEAESTAIHTIEQVRKAISIQDLSSAEEGLNIISQQTAFIENQDIRDNIKDVVFAITELRNQLESEKRAKEEERRKQQAIEAKQRAEALERERQAKEAQKLRDAEERAERDRKYKEELLAKEEAQRCELQQLKKLSASLKPDARDIVKYLRDNCIYYFYHFTEASNIPLIKQRKGLFSWSYLMSHDLKIPYQGGNETSRGLDRDKGLEDYVRLSLCKSHPMAYRIYLESGCKAQLVLLKIKIDVAMFESTLFSNINATDKFSLIGGDKTFVEDNFDFEAINLNWCYASDPRHKKRQAEVMVKTFIPANLIVNLDFPEVMTFNN